MNEYCDICGAQAEAEHHLIFGRGLRDLSDQDNIKIKICNRCHTTGRITERIHDNSMAEKLSKALGQAMWERDYIAGKDATIVKNARDAFRKRYGRSYL